MMTLSEYQKLDKLKFLQDSILSLSLKQLKGFFNDGNCPEIRFLHKGCRECPWELGPSLDIPCVFAKMFIELRVSFDGNPRVLLDFLREDIEFICSLPEERKAIIMKAIIGK